MNLQLEGIALPIRVRPGAPLADLDFERFSHQNEPLQMERNQQGEIVIMSPTGGEISGIEFYILQELGFWTRQDGTGKGFSSSGGFSLPDGSCLSPDAAWISLLRWNRLSKAERKTFPPLCPDFLIELRSTSHSRTTIEEKMHLWMSNGAQLAWLIDPFEASVTVYKKGEAAETLERPDVVVGHAPVAGFSLDCTPLWVEL